MKKHICLYITIIGLCAAASTNASDAFNNAYVAVGGGISIPAKKLSNLNIGDDGDPDTYTSKKVRNSGALRLALGKSFEEVRGEFEYTHLFKHNFNRLETTPKNKAIRHKLHLKHDIFMLNGYYDYKKLGTAFRPYMTVGLGVSRNKLSYENITTASGPFAGVPSKSKTSFAYNAGLGMTFDVNEKIATDIGYKFYSLGKTPASRAIAIAPKNVKGKLYYHMLLASIQIKL